MKTRLEQIVLSTLLACSILIFGIEVSLAGSQPPAPRQSYQAGAYSPPEPDTTFTDNVLIDTPSTPALTLNQNNSASNAAYRWDILANSFEFVVRDYNKSTVPFAIFPNTPSNSLNVTPSGVGIGLPYPNNALRPLHIRKTLGSPGIRLEEVSANGSPLQTYDIVANSTTGFYVDNSTTGSTPFLIDVSDNIGLGTSAPAGKLHVLSGGNQLSIFQNYDNGAVQFRLQTDSTNRRFVALNNSGAQQSQLLFGDNGAFDFLGPTASDVRMRFLANGNVGIGTTAPDQKLSVNGNASKPGGGSWATFSDERLKDIKGEFKSGLDQVMKLKPIRYEYKADNAIGLKSKGEHIGFGAAAVQKVIPEAVTETTDGYLMVDNDPILWTMLNAIKEQNAEINQLKEQNKEIAELKAQLERLQAEVVLSAGTRHPARKQVARNIR